MESGTALQDEPQNDIHFCPVERGTHEGTYKTMAKLAGKCLGSPAVVFHNYSTILSAA